MKWLCLSAIWILSVAACGRPSHEGSPAPDRAIASINCSTGVAQPWSCLERACADSGGSMDAASHECICPNGQVFIGWNKPRCEEPRAASEGAGLNFSATFAEGTTAQVRVSLPQETEATAAQSVAAMLSTHNFPQFTLNRVQIFVPAVSPIRPALLERYLFAPPPPAKLAETSFGAGMYISFPERTYYSTLEELYSILQSTDYADSERDQVGEGLRHAKLINAALAAKEYSESVISYVAIGCLGACEVHRKLNVSQFPDYDFEQTTLWSGGVPYRSFLNISRNGNFPVASVFQSPHGRPLMYAEYEETMNRGKFNRVARFTSATGVPMGEFEFAFDAKEVLDKPVSAGADVLMCEAWYGEDWKRPDLKNHLVRGPLAANAPAQGKSLWGWLAAKSEREFFSGYKPVSPMGHFDWSDYSDPMDPDRYARHFEEVLEQIVGEGDSGLTVAPMTPMECEHHAASGSGLQSLPRVINYSTGDNRSPEACAAGFPQLASTPFLWVIAAGNDGWKDQIRSQTLCPHNSIPSAKRLVVGAVDFKGKVEAYSNQYRGLVDIYAPGNPCFKGGDCSGTPGTSFAAPRVAHVAAKIAKLYPQLTNEQIRMAILLGADTSTRLPALSRGKLDKDLAIKLAERFAAGRSYQDAIYDVSPWGGYSWRATKRAILDDIVAAEKIAEASK